MPALSSYTNVENTALVIIKNKGFQVWFKKEEALYYAEKDGWDFAAPGLVELLGVIAIFEFHKPNIFKEYWWKIESRNLEDNLPAEPASYKPVWKKLKFDGSDLNR